MTTHTIGEVLNRLKGEFDDITISKIRFLESEGLISPDRTESGYRKFSEGDVDRLRYVLRAQRDRYLPLRVIKDELARLDAGLPVDGDELDDDPVAVDGDAAADDGAVDAATSVSHRAATDGARTASGGRRRRPLLDASLSDVMLSAAELADASGLGERALDELRDHGLLAKGPTYDGDDLRVAKLAAQLLQSGLEARHLRMYRQFAEREATQAEALIAPLLRQRNPDSRTRAAEKAEHLAEVGGELHRALLAAELRSILRP